MGVSFGTFHHWVAARLLIISWLPDPDNCVDSSNDCKHIRAANHCYFENQGRDVPYRNLFLKPLKIYGRFDSISNRASFEHATIERRNAGPGAFCSAEVDCQLYYQFPALRRYPGAHPSRIW